MPGMEPQDLSTAELNDLSTASGYTTTNVEAIFTGSNTDLTNLKLFMRALAAYIAAHHG